MIPKRLLMLGGTYAQIPAIRKAKELGHYVITCDYLPENPGHAYADEYHNVSTTDKEAVLNLARNLHVDGVVAYASDPAAPTAAYVSEKLGLASTSYNSVMILGRKDLFRSFLAEHGFNVPKSAGFRDLDSARSFYLQLNKPAMVKPADSSGSKGVRKVSCADEFDDAYSYALSFSRDGIVVVEEYIQRVGPQITGDGFVVDGKLVFTAFMDQYHNESCNPFVPDGATIPSKQNPLVRKKAEEDVQRVLSLLNWKTGALNIEYIVDENDSVYLLEIGPRNGGNFIPDLILKATGVDMIEYTIRGVLGEDCSDLQQIEPKGYFSYYAIHSEQHGVLESISFSSELKKCIRFYQPYLQTGSVVEPFNGASSALGILILEFTSENEMSDIMGNMSNHILIEFTVSNR